MKRHGYLRLLSGIIAGLLIFGAIPSLGFAQENEGQTYIIADYYNEDGSFSELGQALDINEFGESILTVNYEDIFVVGSRRFLVNVEALELVIYTLSTDHIIEWWVVQFASMAESSIVIEIEGLEVYLTGVEAAAFVVKLNGKQNDLYITVAEFYSDGSMIVFEEAYKIENNEAGTYYVDKYEVYIDTKGNDQIRACYIV